MSDSPRTLRQNVRELPRAAWIVCAGAFVNRFGSFVSVFLVLYLTAEGYSAAAAGTAAGAYGVGHLAASAIGGYLTDRIGRRETIVLSMYSAAAAMLALSQAQGLAAITFFVFLIGLSSELYRPASSALLADLVPPEQRVAAFAVWRLAVNAGFALGPAAAGFLADRSFFWLFVGDALTSVVFGTVALVSLPRGRPPAPGPHATGGSIRSMLRHRAFVAFLVASVGITYVYLQSMSVLALHVKAEGLSTSDYGLLVSLNGLLVVFLELPVASVTQRLDARRVIAVGFFVTGLGFALTAFAGTMPLLAATVVLWTIGEVIDAPVSSAYVAELAPEHMRGRYMGAWGLTWSLGLMLAPSVGARFFAAAPDGAWLACGVIGAVAAAIVLLGGRPKMVEPRLPLGAPGPELPRMEG
ncbi:MAG TPA: MFS transporter [Actinomycetota bacterium]|nr:MFS transporter [Actinomycetota bacterium]